MKKKQIIIFLLVGLVTATIISGYIGNKEIKTSPENKEIKNTEYTIAYMSDGRPSKDKANNTNNLTKDFNQIILQIPDKTRGCCDHGGGYGLHKSDVSGLCRIDSKEYSSILCRGKP